LIENDKHKTGFAKTENKQFEERMIESDGNYRRLVESLKQHYFLYSYNAEGIFTYLSPAITNMLGYTQEEFFTHYTDCLTDNPLNKEAKRHSELSIKGEKQPPFLVEVYHKKNSARLLELTEVPVFDEQGHVIAVEGVAHDITELENIKEALRDSQKQYFKIFNSAADCMFIIDEKEIIVNANTAA
jgi:PAS domain S-box-containing protein